MQYKEKRYICIFIVILLALGVFFFLRKDHQKGMSEYNRRELRVLNRLIKKNQFFQDSLKHQMDSVMLQLHKNTDYSDEFRYYTNRRMLQTSQMFSYDYASEFSHKMRKLSDNIGDPNLKAESRILSSFCLAQACLFVEALDMLRSVNLDFPNVNDSILALYYFHHGIAYQRLAVYVNDSVNAKRYNNRGIEMFKKCIKYSADKGKKYFVLGRIYGRQERYEIAQKYFEKALTFIDKDDNILYSLANASLGKCFKHQGKHEQATRYYIKATKYDILHAQNSSIAIIDLTEHLFKHYNQTRDISKYVNLAIKSGEYYGMRSQITHIDKIIPDITKEISKQNMMLVLYLAPVAAIFLIILYSILIRFEKNKKLLKDYLILNDKIKEENNVLHEENEKLSRTNMLLRDSNKLKDSYLGKLFEANRELTNIYEEFAIKADQKLKKSQYDQVQKSIKELQKNFSNKDQLDRFDELFMSLFPTFIVDFNALLQPENRKQEGQTLLNPTMRIFALLRLGITDNQQIARILNYSYNTILNYRVRARAMAINAKTFEQDVMKIGS